MSGFSGLTKNASLGVRKLKLVTSGDEVIPLRSVSISMGIGATCTCSCVPVVGRDAFKGRTERANVLEKLRSSDACYVVLQLHKNDHINNNDPVLFVGRPMSSDMNFTTNPFGSSIDMNIMLQHVAQSDLGAVSIGERSYYMAINPFRDIFRMDPGNNGSVLLDRFINTNLIQTKMAVYLKDLCRALVDWYMHGKHTIKVNKLLKAVPCHVRDSIRDIKNISAKQGSRGVVDSFIMAVNMAFNGALASKASLLSILSTLSSFAMLNIVPTLESLLITPKLDVTRWTEDTGVAIPRKWLVGVSSPNIIRRLPIKAVCLNKRFGNMYLSPDRNLPSITGLQDWGLKYRYPEYKSGDGVLLVDPPPIMANVIDCAANVAMSNSERPLSIDKGGVGTEKNSVGATPINIPQKTIDTLGKAAARLMWSKLAFAHRTTRLSLLPHWVFGPGFDEDIHADYEAGVPWSLLGKDVLFAMPYRSDKGSAKTDVPYVGYVKGMNIQVSTEGPALSVSANLSNVRTAEEDEKFASPKDSNPLYTNVNAKPV